MEMLTGMLPFTGPTPMAAMNDRLLNHPLPPRVADPSVSPELQEILYRALERDPKYDTRLRRSFIYDLEHPDQVGIEERPELLHWQKRKPQLSRKILYYSGLALIPVVILLIMVLISRSR